MLVACKAVQAAAPGSRQGICSGFVCLLPAVAALPCNVVAIYFCLIYFCVQEESSVLFTNNVCLTNVHPAVLLLFHV
jgi:hypothetical protein